MDLGPVIRIIETSPSHCRSSDNHLHPLGYRAQRAVVRELRLVVGTHLAVRSLKQLRQLMERLDERYQVSVDVGQQERETADRMLHDGRNGNVRSLRSSRLKRRGASFSQTDAAKTPYGAAKSP